MSFFIFRSAARFLGSVFFPFFTILGENEITGSEADVIITRNRGLISLLNAFRFFSTPFVVVVRKKHSQGFIWKLMQWAGIDICLLNDEAGAQEIFSLIENDFSRKLPVLFMIDESNRATDDDVVKLFPEHRCLFFAVSGCKDCWSLGFIPVVRDMKAFCGCLPLFPGTELHSRGVESLEIMENILESSAEFETPSFFPKPNDKFYQAGNF
ncbi:MAG: hypothetical protein ACQETH_07515 [Candidatus Rifleibacteriota bacterium]